jgi:D-beta-D-heptose 7-phosphate kinase/D-beta-D-heptose 1-phosphate adenosyltransferase
MNIEAFVGQRVLVLGDLVLDRYWRGAANRLSPEAPVPVLLKQSVDAKPGGAANTAANLASLGADVEIHGAVGHDTAASELREALQASGVNRLRLLTLPGRPTTTKTRIVASHQQVVRLDEEETTPLADADAGTVRAQIRESLPQAAAVVVSDYAKGFLTPALLRGVLDDARAAGVATFIDPKGADHTRYRGAAYLKPNRPETGILAGQPARNHRETLAAARVLRSRLPGTNLLVTEAEDGMTFLGTDGAEIHVARPARQVFDITGAGDTVLAAFSLAIVSGWTPEKAVWLATVAAEIAIATFGAARVSLDQLRSAMMSEAAPVSAR